MRKCAMLVTLAIILLISGAVYAKTDRCPSDKSAFTIDFPDAWKVQLDTQDIDLLAQSPDQEIEYNIWALSAKQVKGDVKAALNEAVKEVKDIVDEYVTNPKFCEGEPSTVNGIGFLSAEGEAKYKDGGQRVFMEVNFFSPGEKAIYFLIYWGTKEGEKKNSADI